MQELATLDDPALFALTGPQAPYRVQLSGAYRYHPSCGVFAALTDHTDESLYALSQLVIAHGDVAFLKADPPAEVPGLTKISQDPGLQMIAARSIGFDAALFEWQVLTDADAPDMLKLAQLTRPGPFFAATHCLGAFVGVKIEGKLVAMAGERMRPAGYCEVSGVCTHPDQQGKGYAARLSAIVAHRIQRRGEVPFLHTYSSNVAALALYRKLGFEVRREILMTRFSSAD